MTLKEDALLRVFLDALQMTAQRFKPNFDADVDKYLKTFKSNISALMFLPDSLSPKSNGHAELSKAKQKILIGMKERYEKMEKDWFDHLASMKPEFLKKIEEFLHNTKLEVKLPDDLCCLDENSDSSKIVHSAAGPGSSSQYRVNQESTHISNLKPNTFLDTYGILWHTKTDDMQNQASRNSSSNHSEQHGQGAASNLMPSTSQDNSGALCHIKIENIQQASSHYSEQQQQRLPLHYSEQQIRTVEGSNNKVIPHSPVNTFSAPCQSSEPSISNQSVTNWLPDILAKLQIIISTPSIELASSSPHTLAMNSSIENMTGQNFNTVSRSITYSAPQIQPEVGSPKKKPSDCSVCSKSFSHPSLLKEHMRKHSKARPYICKNCCKGFKSKGGLKMHSQHRCKKRSQ